VAQLINSFIHLTVSGGAVSSSGCLQVEIAVPLRTEWTLWWNRLRHSVTIINCRETRKWRTDAAVCMGNRRSNCMIIFNSYVLSSKPEI